MKVLLDNAIGEIAKEHNLGRHNQKNFTTDGTGFTRMGFGFRWVRILFSLSVPIGVICG